MSSKKTPDPPPDARTGGGPDAENAPGRLAAEHAQALAALRERVKELDCLYDITRLSQRQDLTLGDMLAGVAQIVARAWQYPEVTCARVVVGGRAFATQNYRRPKSRQSSPVSVRGERIGRVEVGYLEEAAGQRRGTVPARGAQADRRRGRASGPDHRRPGRPRSVSGLCRAS